MIINPNKEVQFKSTPLVESRPTNTPHIPSSTDILLSVNNIMNLANVGFDEASNLLYQYIPAIQSAPFNGALSAKDNIAGFNRGLPSRVSPNQLMWLASALADKLLPSKKHQDQITESLLSKSPTNKDGVGLTYNMVKEFEADIQSNWDIQLSHIPTSLDGSPDVPLLSSFLGFLPISSYDLTSRKMTNDRVADTPIFDLQQPTLLSKHSNLTTTIVCDLDGLVEEWLRKYRDYMIREDGLIVPYKECCLKITIYWWITKSGTSISKDVLVKKHSFYAYPDLSVLTKSGATQSETTAKSYNITWNICGEEDNGELFSSFEIGRK